jgi:hypothetical protein
MAMTKTEGGTSYPAKSYLSVPDPEKPSTWGLRFADENGDPDRTQCGQCWAALTSNYRGQPYQGDDKAEALAKLKRIYKEQNWPLPDGSKAGAEPSPSDVHVDGVIGAQPATRKSPLLRRLMQGLRARLASKPYLTKDDIESEYRSALGHAGGTAKAAADPTMTTPAQAEPSDWAICPACSAIDPADVPSPDCTCPACAEGMPEECLCAALVAEMAAEDVPAQTPAQAAEHPLTIEVGGETFRLYVESPKAFTAALDAIQVLPKPGTYKHPNYGDIVITPERNANFVRNFQQGVYQSRVPIDAEHQTKVSGALGWLTGLSQNTDGSVDGAVEWTDRGRSMLAADRFRYVSPEWYDSWRDPATNTAHADILIGAALTSRPFFKEGALRPLVASEHGIRIGDDPRLFTSEPFVGATSPGPEEGTMADDAKSLTEDEIKRFREIESENAALKQAAEDSKTAAETAQAEAKAASERIQALEVENRRRAFTEQAKEWQGDTTAHVSFMESLPTDELRQVYATQQESYATALTEAQKAAKLFRPVGYAGQGDTESATRQFTAKVGDLVKEGIEYGEAMVRVARENPGLAQDYRNENTNRA